MKRRFRKFTKEERNRLGLESVPPTMYAVDRDLRQAEREELPISYGEDREEPQEKGE